MRTAKQTIKAPRHIQANLAERGMKTAALYTTVNIEQTGSIQRSRTALRTNDCTLYNALRTFLSKHAALSQKLTDMYQKEKLCTAPRKKRKDTITMQ